MAVLQILSVVCIPQELLTKNRSSSPFIFYASGRVSRASKNCQQPALDPWRPVVFASSMKQASLQEQTRIAIAHSCSSGAERGRDKKADIKIRYELLEI